MSQKNEGSVIASLIEDISLHHVPKPSTLTALIQRNDLDGLEAYLNSATSNVSSNEINGAFLWACNAGHKDAVSILIKNGVDVNTSDQFGASALHHAVQGCHPDVVNLLINSGARFEDWVVEEESLLHWASRNGFDDVINTLINLKASLTLPDGYGRYPIHTACLYGRAVAVPVLLSKSSQSPSSTLKRDKPTQVVPPRFSTLIPTQNSYGPDVIDANGWTPLHYACTSSDSNAQEAVIQLLKLDANPLIVAPNGKSAIDLAFESGRDYLFLSYLPASDILLILTKSDCIRPEKTSHVPTGQTDGRSIGQNTQEQELGKGNMKKVKSNYSFLHDVFHRISRYSDGKASAKPVRRGTIFDPLAKLKEWSTTTVWKNILQNDDTELLELLRDFRVLESETHNQDSSFNNFEDAYQLETHILSEIHLGCSENGLAVFSYIKGRFYELLEDMDYRSIFLELTQFNAKSVGPECIDGCTVLWPIHSSIIFIALLSGRLKVVEMLLRMRQFDILPTTFVVILIMRRIEKQVALSDDIKCSLCVFADKLEAFAVDIANKIFLRDNSKEKKLLISFINKPLGCLGRATIIDIAARASCETFLSLPCSQIVLFHLWHGKLHSLPSFWRILTRICPPLLPLYFVYRGGSQREQSYDYSRHQATYSHVEGRHCENPRYHKASNMDDLTQLSIFNKMKLIKYAFTVPSNKFMYHSLFHLIFLVIFSYVLLYDFDFHVSFLEALCYAFLIGYTIEEGRQIIIQGLDKKLWDYVTDTWNIFDLIAIIITITGFILRLTLSFTTFTNASNSETVENPTLFAARVLLLSGLLVFYMRILIVFSLFARLGPKLRMMLAMVWHDLIPMLCIFGLFLVAFGILFQAILSPNGYDLVTVDKNDSFVRQSPQIILSNIVRRSFYGMMAAEYNMEMLESPIPESCNSSSNCKTIVSVSRNLIAYGFQILYVLIVNIMLVNLLIALYSNTVAHINEKSTALWLADKYSLAHEFQRRSVCPPPFNVISTFVELILSCRRRRRNEYHSKNLQCNCRTIRYLVIQAFALRKQRYKIGKTQTQETNEILERLSSMDGEISEIKRLLKRST